MTNIFSIQVTGWLGWMLVLEWLFDEFLGLNWFNGNDCDCGLGKEWLQSMRSLGGRRSELIKERAWKNIGFFWINFWRLLYVSKQLSVELLRIFLDINGTIQKVSWCVKERLAERRNGYSSALICKLCKFKNCNIFIQNLLFRVEVPISVCPSIRLLAERNYSITHIIILFC